MTDILSQEEIDRLLKAAETDAGPDLDALPPGELRGAERVAGGFLAAIADHLSQVLPKDVALSTGAARVVAIEELEPTRYFLLRCSLAGGFRGECALLLRHRDGKALADLLLGGTGAAADEPDPAERQALTDAWSAIAARGAVRVSEELGVPLSATEPVLEEVARGALSRTLPWTSAFSCPGNLRIVGALDASLCLLLPLELALAMGQRCGSATSVSHTGRHRGASAEGASGSPGSPKEGPTGMRNLDLILDLDVDVMVRLGEAVLPLEEVRKLGPGSILTLDRDSEAPVDLLVNGRVVAKGELVVVGADSLAVRITEIETPSERIRTLGA